MANLLDKAIKLRKKEHKIKAKLLFPKGRTAYILKRQGGTEIFTVLAIFENYGVDFSLFRHSTYFEFAAGLNETFEPKDTARPMTEIARIATHIAVVDLNGDSVVHAVANGDEDKPHYLDFAWRFYAVQISDTFIPADYGL